MTKPSDDLAHWGPLAIALAAAERPTFTTGVAPSPPDAAVETKIRPRRRLRLAVTAAALMVIALGSAATWMYARFVAGQR
jgi:hypothetical protein